MGSRQILGIFVLSICLFSQFARAEIYQPGRGILLLKKGKLEQVQPNQPSQTPNLNPDTRVIQNGIITQPQTNSPVQVVPSIQNNSNSNSSAQKVTTAYASHLYSGICADEYRARIAPLTEPNLNQQKMWSDIKASCSCMSSQILSVIPATDLADYVMYNYGSQNGSTPDPQTVAYQASAKNNQIDSLLINGELKKKCGFLK